MSTLHWMRAAWQCEGCGKDFIVVIDQGRSIPPGWDLVEIARDAIRGGECVEIIDKYRCKTTGIANSSSIQDGVHLCPECTHIVDEAVPGERNATRQEIETALGIPADAIG